MQKAIIYTRVSTDEQAEKGFSLRDQKDRLERYCRENNIEVVKHFQDDASAKTFERPAWRELMQFLSQNKGIINKVLVLKWDRFSRDASLSYQTRDKLKKLGVEVDAIEQSINSNVPENQILQALYFAVPEVENKRRSINTMSGMRKAKKEGRWVASAPFGYKNSRDAQNKPQIIPSEKAVLVEHAFKLYSSGMYDKEQVRKMLIKEGMTLTKNAFATMLHNPVYIGKIRIEAWENEIEEIVDAIHQPIVSQELYNQVQIIALGKKRKLAKPQKQNSELPLRGNLTCSKCGKNLTGSASKGNGGKYFYYHCRPGCTERFRAENAHDSFEQWLESISIKPEIASLYLAIMEDVFKTEEGDREKEIAVLEMEKLAKQETLTKASVKLVNDDIDKPTFLRIKAQMESESNDLTNRINTLKYTETGFQKYSRYSFSLLSDLKRYYKEAELDVKQKLVGLIFPKKLVFEDNTYRTNSSSDLLNLLTNTGAGFNGYKKEKASVSGSQSCQVSPPGLEPWTR